jgi:hypothetical protein
VLLGAQFDAAAYALVRIIPNTIKILQAISS